ncbi:MAG: sigma-E processing peptidase SpoIIGA [Clostridia bacterium]|nr:sigma-E processing peptidase SpoIIGA [Clostridia bacterium]
MVVYIEYAFAENFLLDGLLLYLALFTANVTVKFGRLAFAAAVGAIGALAIPLLPVSAIWAYPIKFLGGGILCLLAGGKKRFWRVCAAFFVYSFAFAGAMFAIVGIQAQTNGYFISQTGATFVVCAGAILTLLGVAAVKKLRTQRALRRHIYACKIRYRNRELRADGFLDSGNFAHLKGRAVCFVAPDVAYELQADEFWEQDGGQVQDELQISTLGGVKTLPAFDGVIEIETDEKTVVKKVYFAVSANILSREYKLLLHSRILDD